MTKATINSFPLSVGRERGYPVTKNKTPSRPSYRRGKLTKKAKFTRDLVRELVGPAPYEKRVDELLRIGKDKRALKFLKKRVGGHLRSKRKREEMNRLRLQAKKKKQPDQN